MGSAELGGLGEEDRVLSAEEPLRDLKPELSDSQPLTICAAGKVGSDFTLGKTVSCSFRVGRAAMVFSSYLGFLAFQ